MYYSTFVEGKMEIKIEKQYLLNLSLLMIYNEGDITAMCINTNTVYSY